ncbi:arylamine N-acetyltransferase, pineal gland isozyme NAT-3-like [Scophthalmus maximus]|uniref:arylamine N-acetyltransferase n=1 Tax=Scophthalmus maximus TaxID=52904 RepID=A0A8D3B5J7_SCOMX|nr:arylamine N-acetyltransferase, pineal gland isozyme NAT-3-like [Scophthalmus maximus]XP_035474984.1 arylamine N-acetyltransferase, pineal gland isozyme NAT-3-like [Scophthalmus maximus]XP_035474985.1 arylamine N-acetyltransferase, pineal gland isozyme NAT-3-like [Scophthalmus maximus]XP_035474986.1 arylamine N-acetyltransferase, pineal gland isozyme NAT-3-like [Scophthalmus maximus]
MDMQKYLARIGLEARAPAAPSLDALRSVHARHLLSVPFEDLTAHSGGRVRLALPLLYDKLVVRRRGGFCCENNGLFSWLLSALGFRVTVLSAQVRSAITGCYGPPFDHLTLAVTLQGRRWLCDVGFGAPGFTTPLSLETTEPQAQGHRVYRVRRELDARLLEWQGEENRGVDGEWTELYKFTLAPRRLEDFAEMCLYHQTSPCSLFYCKSLCTVVTPTGRLTYIGRRLVTVTFPCEATGGLLETTTEELQDEEIPVILAEKFGIVLDSQLVPKDEAITPPPVMY